MRMSFPSVRFEASADAKQGESLALNVFVTDAATGELRKIGLHTVLVGENITKGQELQQHPEGVVWVRKL